MVPGMTLQATPLQPLSNDQQLLKTLNQQTIRISQLEDANRVLRAQIRTYHSNEEDNTSKATRGEDELAQDSMPLGQDALEQAYELLQNSYNRCQRDLSQLQKGYAKLDSKYELAKQATKDWSRYCRHLKTKQTIGGQAVQTYTVAGAENSPRLYTVFPTPNSEMKADDQDLRDTTSTKQSTVENQINTTSSQSTEVEEAPTKQPSMQLGSDDEPTIVSERHLKRRRLNPSTPRIKQEPGISTQPVMLVSDSSPNNTSKVSLSTQISDLNDSPQVKRDLHHDSESRSIEHDNTIDFKNSKKAILQHATPNTTVMKRPHTEVAERRGILTPISNNISLPKKYSTSIKPPVKRLRLKPVQDLELDDFRPNPSFRGPIMPFYAPLNPDTKDRVCLPGCTRAACCGHKYRKMVELGGTEVTGKTDLEVLQAYLGPGFRDVMASYGPEKRKELVLQAHAMSFAQSIGGATRKRVRAATPPGFWRTDMPSTQELQEQHEQADRIERRRVEERHHEALRPGGEWIFRDEL